jgi:hypothetical protein
VPVKPLFIFSLPRSGSTLLQRVLAVNSQIATVAEPWVLLPFIYPMKPHGVYAEYSHASAHAALMDFMAELPNGEADYLDAVNQAASSLYRKISPSGARYFLDKTPRYALICGEIIRAFPEAKFIFLWRNPLSIIASMMETFDDGRWNAYRLKVDLFDGLANLIRTYKERQDQCLSVTYEDLIVSPEIELKRISRYLDIELDPSMLEEFAKVRFRGSMGDAKGMEQYQSLSVGSLDKWKMYINTPFRKYWCRRYLNWIGSERLALMKCNLAHLQREIGSVRTRWSMLPSDVIRALYGIAYCALEPAAMKLKLKYLLEWKWVKPHS